METHGSKRKRLEVFSDVADVLDVVACVFFWPMNATIDSEVPIMWCQLVCGVGGVGVWSRMFILIYC